MHMYTEPQVLSLSRIMSLCSSDAQVGDSLWENGFHFHKDVTVYINVLNYRPNHFNGLSESH